MHRAWSKRPYLFIIRALSARKLLLVKVALSFAVLAVATIPFVIGSFRPAATHASTEIAYDYTKKFDTTTDGGYVNGTGVTTDSNGDVYVTGSFTGTVIFNPSDPSTAMTAPYWYSAFVTKYNPDGSYAWTQTFNSFDYEYDDSVQATNISVDSSGNVYVVGTMYGEGDFNGDDLGSGGYADFVTQIQSDGSYGWTDIINGYSTGVGVTADSNGYIYVADGDTLTQLDSSGNTISSVGLDSTSGEVNATSVSSDSSGNVYVTGNFYGSVVFGGVNAYDYSGSSSYCQDTFLSEYNSNNAYQWTNTTNESSCGDNAASGVTVDSSGNIYVVGSFNTSVIFNPPDVGSALTGSNWGSGYLTKYNSSGVYQWTEVINNNGSGYHPGAATNGVAVDNSGQIYVTGTMSSQAASGDDEYLQQYNPDGSVAATSSFDTTNGEAAANAIAIDTAGNIYLTGWATGTVIFDGTGGSDSQVMGSNDNLFLTRYTPYHPITATTVGSGNISVNELGTTPSVSIASDLSGQTNLSAITCTSPTTCLATGNDNNGLGVTTIGTLSGGTWVWTPEVAVTPDGSGSGGLDAISCSDYTTCIAAGIDGNGQSITTVGTFSAGDWTWSAESPITSDGSGSGDLYGISCPDSTTCIAVGYDGNGQGIATVGTLSGGSWTWTAATEITSDSSGVGYLKAVSCSSTITCIAVGFDNNNQSTVSIGTLSGGSWTWTAESTIASDSSGYGFLDSISCPDSTTCVAVGNSNDPQSVTTVGTLSGGIWTWTTETDITSDSAGEGYLNSISCPSSTTCVASGEDTDNNAVSTVGTLSGGIWTWTAESSAGLNSPRATNLTGIMCISTTTCETVGVDQYSRGLAVSGTISGGGISWGSETIMVSDSTGNGEISSVSCADSSTCIGIGGDSSNQATVSVGSLSDGTWSWSTEVPIVSDSSGNGSLYGINCSDSTTCIAVGEDGNGQSIDTVGTLSGGTWSWSTEVPIVSDSSGNGSLYGINCSDSTTCIAVGEDGNGQSIDTVGTLSGGTWSWSTEVPIAPDSSGNGYLQAINCSSSTTCLAVGYDGNDQSIFTVGTLSGGTWSWSTEVPIVSDSSGSGYLYGISCINTTSCVAVGSDNLGQGVSALGTLSGGTWTWSSETAITPDSSGYGSLYSVSCLSSGICLAAGDDDNNEGVMTLGTFANDNITWTTESAVTPDSTNYGGLNGVTCYDADDCVALGWDGNEDGAYTQGSLFGAVPGDGFLAIDGSNQIFNITPNAGYQISNVLVDGVSVGTPSSYTFTNVTVGHTIEADFTPITYNITASTTGSGSISLTGLNTSPYSSVTPDGTGQGPIADISCTSSTTCVAVGHDNSNHGVTTTGTLSGGSWSWTTEVPVTPDVSGGGTLYGVSCASSTMCVAVGSDDTAQGINSIGTLSGGVWSWTADSTVTSDATGYGNLSDISCPDSTTCVAVGADNNHQGITTIGTLSSGVWSWTTESVVTPDSSDEGALFGVSCATSTTCVAVGYDNYGQSITSVGTLSGGVWSWTTESPVSGGGALFGIDCTTSTSCVAVGLSGSQSITSVGTLSGGVWSWSAEAPVISDATNTGQLYRISCATSTTCVAVGQDNDGQSITSVGTLSGGVWSWSAELAVTPDASGGGSLSGVDCMTSTTCVAVGGNNDDIGTTVVGTLTSGPVPGGGLAIGPGYNQSFSIVPSAGYQISDVLVDGSSVGAVSSYAFTNVMANHTIEADFTPITYNITASTTGSGSISPDGVTGVDRGSDQTYSITPGAGGAIADVLVDGNNVGDVTSYIFTNVTTTHTIEADFISTSHTLTVSSGSGGNVSPSGATLVNNGDNQVIDITPATGYHISTYSSNGSYSCTPSGNDAVCTVSNITSDQYFVADFSLDTETLTVSAETGGSVSPAGTASVDYDGSQVINVTPGSGYYITGYSSNGSVSCTPSGANSICTVSNITADRYFTANFAPTPVTPASTFTITASVDGPGSISPSGDVTVTDNGLQVFTMTANSGSNISKVLVDGVDQGPISSYSFSNVTAAHTIEAVFSTPAGVATTTRPTTHTAPTVIAAAPKPAPNPISAITRFVSVQFNRVPTPIAIGFPWLLLILLLLMVLWATRLAYREARTVEARTELLREEKRLSETKDTFLQLATHYLSTPLAKLTTGLELLTNTDPDLAILPKLQSQTADVRTASEHILETVNSDSATVQSNASTSLVSDKIIGQAWRRLWIMVVVIGILGFLIDSLAHSARQIRTSTLAEATHAAIYVLLCFILYGVLRYYRIQHQNHEATDGLISTQDNLSASRSRLIQTAYQNLSVPVGSISLTTKELSSNTPAGRSILMSIADYRTILDKLKIVVELRNVPIASAQSVGLINVLEPAIISLSPAIEAKHLSVSYANDIAEQKVLADPGILSKIVTPILDNAIKFSADKGIITIGYEVSRGNLALTIADNGQGIDPEYMTRLFQPFSRAEADALTFNHEGIGLSLYTSRLLAESLHGDISLSSEVGKGTVVSIKLPKPTKAALAKIARQQTTTKSAGSIKQQVAYG